MQYLVAAAALLATTVLADKRDLCSDGSVDVNGNWYCQNVNAITYTGVGGKGSYKQVTSMGSGTCASQPKGYSGNLSPLDEEVSLHFRGPLQLKQFAVYTPGEATASKAKREEHVKRHAHGHGHAHGANKIQERQVGAIVTATIDGQIVSWINEYSGQTSTAAAAAAPAASSPVAAVQAGSSPASSGSSSAPSAKASSAGGSIGSTSGGWGRQAYYNSASKKAEGLVFLNHNGGQGSGVFDMTFGNSLSYASSDGTSGASSPQVLADTTLPSVAEVVIMSDKQCNNDCPFSRPGTVAHHGFGGAQKAFFFEFSMPSDGTKAASIYTPSDMPAIWMLNAQIPRTLQYGQAECSCWESGCGEFDIFEVLAPGDTRCKSTLHGNVSGGDSDYFTRPTGSTIKAALVLYNNNIHIKILDDATDFGSVMDAGIINNICGSTLTQSKLVSLFNLVGAASG